MAKTIRDFPLTGYEFSTLIPIEPVRQYSEELRNTAPEDRPQEKTDEGLLVFTVDGVVFAPNGETESTTLRFEAKAEPKIQIGSRYELEGLRLATSARNATYQGGRASVNHRFTANGVKEVRPQSLPTPKA